MANINITSDAWTEISITSGTVQNISATADIELSAEQTDNSGVVLKPSEIYQWDNETIYARAVTESQGALRVVNFKKATGGGGSYVLPVASASTLGGVKIGSGLSIDGDGVLASTGGGNPVGTIISFMGASAPTNYLVCDGTAYNITDYQTLADHIATQFGAVDFFGGDGVSTFAVPDLRGEFLRGTGTNGHTNQGNGANVGVHQDATEQNIFVASSVSDKTIQIRGVDGSAYAQIDSANRDSVTSSNKAVNFASASATASSSTVDSFYTTRPTNTSVLYCIKYQ